MPARAVWIVTLRPKARYVGVAGGIWSAEQLVRADATARAARHGIPETDLAFHRERLEPDEGQRLAEHAPIFVSARRDGVADLRFLTYDCRYVPVVQRVRSANAVVSSVCQRP